MGIMRKLRTVSVSVQGSNVKLACSNSSDGGRHSDFAFTGCKKQKRNTGSMGRTVGKKRYSYFLCVWYDALKNPDLSIKSIRQLFCDYLTEICSGITHSQQDPSNLQAVIQSASDFLHCPA